MNIRVTLIFLLSMHVPCMMKANDTSSIVIQNSSLQSVDVLIQTDNHPSGCVYQATTFQRGQKKTLDHICYYTRLDQNKTFTYLLNLWPGRYVPNQLFNIYIEDSETNALLGVKKNIRAGTKLEFPRNFDLE